MIGFKITAELVKYETQGNFKSPRVRGLSDKYPTFIRKKI